MLGNTPHQTRLPKRLADENYPVEKPPALPSFLRTVWEWKEDIAVVNSWLLVLCFAQMVALLLVGGVLWYKIHEPTRIVLDLPGYVVWPKSDVFRLREDMVANFLREIGKALYEVNPGSYNIMDVGSRVSPHVVRAFRDVYGPLAASGDSQRIVWDLREIRRYVDPKRPKYLTIAARANRARYRVRNGLPEITTEEVIHLFYLSEVIPTPDNPVGLRLDGVQEYRGPEGEKLWQLTVPVAGSVDPSTKDSILPPKSSSSDS
ncbi:hypothetical protein [Candidatus Methylacidithermus pantelleriae]|uniref:Uncharacterized protein n=1 Tax=Candidatus Methylacidithermus pantelleriae TaxID=2744239 RepID=A0A8J2BSQ4_9BACT|nr:hypothetical protein [Candidatus Methylacidithermus pantelleriae]CAF0704870.1 conserved hypothetical protein [Candidatus Methylacidithermus pantelleriae]